MSGIVGVIRLAEHPREAQAPQVLAPVLDRMAASLAHRGPDGVGLWADEPQGAALGHLALHATPEAAHEELPLRDEEAGLVLTCDARLDNRDELLQVLGGGLSDEVGDGELILAAYKRWGRGCAQHLLGDFAFAIWDEKSSELFCARDHVGVKPLYFHHEPGSLFAFASEIKALFEVPGIGREVDEVRVAEYLTAYFSSHTNTSFAGIERLPAAHTLVASARGIEVERYWDLREAPVERGLSDAECERRFREVLFEAVRCRLRAPGENGVAAFLSGGLDSSSVSAVAREVRREQGIQGDLPVFSTVFEEVPECDERPFMEAVLQMGGLSPHWIRGEARSPLMGLEGVLRLTDEPILGPNLCSTWAHYPPVRAAGARVILDGHGGDEVVGYGQARLAELVQAGNWVTLWRELRALERNGFLAAGPGAAEMMRDLLARGLKPLRLARRLKHAVSRRLPLKNSENSRHGKDDATKQVEARPEWEQGLSAEFARKIGAREVFERWRAGEPRQPRGDRAFNEATLSLPLQSLAFEELDKAAAAAGVEARYPLWDKRLVELCLSLPPEQKLRNGWTRSILRRALEGVLPPEVQWRASKNDFTPEAWRGLRVHEEPRLRALADGKLPLSSKYLDAPEASRSARLILEGEPAVGPVQTVVRVASLEAWLVQQAECVEVETAAEKAVEKAVEKSEECSLAHV